MSKNKKNRKMTRKKWVILITMIVAAALLVIFLLPNLFRPDASALASAMRTTTVETGTIETTVVGSGNLTAQNTTDIKIPSGVTVENVLVEAGDTVAAGDPLATLDAASVKTALAETQTTLASLDSQIDSAKDESGSQYITTSVSGRVKQIFAEAGTNTQTTVSESGALLILSIDGKMKVSFQPSQTDVVSSGESVVVTLSDGTTQTGTVTSLTSESCTITLTDNGPAYGDTVTIMTKDGTQIGTGTLEINTPISILGSAGTVQSIDVSLNESVSSGATLITLTEAAVSEEYATLLAQRAQYEDVLRALIQYEQTNTITAETAGTISSVSITGTSDASSAESSASSSQSSSAGTPAASMASGSLDVSDNSIQLLSTDANTDSRVTLLADSATVSPISGTTEIFINNPVTGNTPQTTVMPGSGYTGVIRWSPMDAKFAAGTSYSATVTLTADSSHQFASDATVNVQGARIDAQSIVVSTDASGNTLTFDAVFPATEQAAAATNNAPQTSSEESSSGSPISGSSAGGGSSSGGSSSGGSVSTTAATASSSDTAASETSLLTTAFTISSGKADTLSVNIDELDIMSVQAGQDVSIVLDALPDETFSGTVTKISASGTIQSGVTTYPVTITLTDVSDADILAGMNATATISISTSENVLLIPLDALQESGSEKFVLIAGSSDGEAGMGERQTVETGLSDGTSVEIISGLSEGDQIMYEESTSTDSTEQQSGFPGGSMGGMGGGTPPEGNMQGGGMSRTPMGG
ncbi:MAG: biotin/lipoyl-binding protein [Christensenella sp.]|uniref:biotin/lipoyl-binding protein n=1 Tax=Christensenella sp. TaxID=1935934 RepID=UPI002B213CD7|nr:biotin/lipoyl-binding protein [Christensenella sp.]MEA5002690.1 biotin/lipoyl-binding protein [Christensenella sp.]